ncbi:hypothetical protein TSOC_015311, partial [Tetrabaena socialis]
HARRLDGSPLFPPSPSGDRGRHLLLHACRGGHPRPQI